MFLFKQSLSKIFKTSIVLIVISIVLLNLIPLSIEKTKRENEMKAAIENALEMQQMFITRWLEERIVDIQTLASLPAVKEFDTDKMLHIFQPFVEKNRDFLTVVYANKDGIVELDVRGIAKTKIDLSDRKYFIEGKKGKTYVSEVMIARDTALPIITFSNPVYNRNGEFQGVVFAPVTLTSINNVMKEFWIGKTGRTYLVDKNGVEIARLSISDEETESESPRKIILEDQLIRAKEEKPFAKYYKNDQGIEVMGSYRWVNNGNWLMIVEVEKKEVIQSFFATTFAFSGISLLVLIVAYLFMSKVNQRINEPIQYLVNGAKSIIKGEYSTRRIDPVQISKSPVELQELCDVFNEMSAKISENITEIKQSEEKLRTIISTAQDAIIIVDSHMKIISWNKSAETIFGYTEEEIIGSDISIIKPKKYLKDYYKSLNDFFSSGKTSISGKTVEFEGIRKDGSIIPIELSLNSWQVNGELYFCGIIRDISVRKEAEKKLKELSIRDGLTKIYNRRYFDEVYQQEWNIHVKRKQPLTILLFDIDHFKKYNDTYGHLEGDNCLIKVAQTVEQYVKEKNYFFARYGGEEFIVILPNTDESEARIVAEHIHGEISKLQIPHEASDNGYITVSMGVATMIPEANIPFHQLIKWADDALYKGKEKGRNNIYYY